MIYALQRAFVAVEARKAGLLAEVDLLPAHYALMMNVRSNPGVTGAELARLVGVTPQNIAGLVARLTDRGLIERRPHDRHPHVLELRLTTTGARRLADADALVAELENELLLALGPEMTGPLRAGLENLRSAATGQ